MSKLDWTQIEGYSEEMTAEEKLALLENHEFPATEPKYKEKVISKDRFDKVASELAAANRKLKAKLTEDELKEAERQAEAEAIQEELNKLRHEKTISTYKANYLSLGLEEALAIETSEAMADNDMETVFANLKKHLDVQKKTWESEFMKKTSTPPPGDHSDEDLKKEKELALLRQSMGLPITK